MGYSEKFYARYADRYAEVSHQLIQSIYIESSHPKLTNDLDLIESESEDQLGGLMFFTDPKHAPHCVFHMQKKPHKGLFEK